MEEPIKLKKGDLVKHYKGNNLIEKNIYEILSVNPEYTGDKEFPSEACIIYAPVFQKEKNYIREYADFVKELTSEEKERFSGDPQDHRVELLTEQEMILIQAPSFIHAKEDYLKEIFGDKEEQEKPRTL